MTDNMIIFAAFIALILFVMCIGSVVCEFLEWREARKYKSNLFNYDL